MATFVNVDVVPQTGRPDAVTSALTEAIALRDRHRDANETLAAAQTALEQAQQADVAATAEKIRAGTQPGAIPASVQKAKQAVELAQRNALARDADLALPHARTRARAREANWRSKA
jgi:hypothetical protein